jgi:hypothetical protein
VQNIHLFDVKATVVYQMRPVQQEAMVGESENGDLLHRRRTAGDDYNNIGAVAVAVRMANVALVYPSEKRKLERNGFVDVAVAATDPDKTDPSR